MKYDVSIFSQVSMLEILFVSIGQLLIREEREVGKIKKVENQGLKEEEMKEEKGKKRMPHKEGEK